MPPQYLDANGNPAAAPPKVYLDPTTGEPVGKSTSVAPFVPTASFNAPPTTGQKFLNLIQHPLNTMAAASTPINRPKDASIPAMAATDLYNVGAGATGVFRHPLDTLGGILGGIGGVFTAPFESIAGRQNEFQQLGHEADVNGPQMGATMLGQSLAMPVAGRMVAPVAAPVLRAAGRVASIGPKVLRAGADALAGTTPELVQKLGEKAQEANIAAAAQRGIDLQKHFEKTQAVRAQNEAAQAVASRKAALDRGVEQLDPKFQEDLKATEKNVRGQANAKYDAVRAATAGETVPSASLADAVKAAESKIQGSSENLKVFRDILSKHPENAPDTITYQGAEIPKGHPLYDVLAEGENASAAPATFSDLQGYYSELGNQLAKGNLPGDVYQAMKSLQGSVGDLMQQMAESKGAGGILTDARGFYHDYMNAFRDSKSPLNRAMNATERGQAIKQLQGKDQSGVGVLARYNPELAQRANTIRGYQAEAKSIPARSPTLKPEPTLSPAPAPQTVTLDAIRQAKEAQLLNKKGPVGGELGHLASGAGSWHIISSAMYGNPEGVVLGGAVASAPYALGKLLRSPGIVKLLSEPTPSDIAAIPADVRPQLPAIVKAAQAQGIKVHPALVSMAGPVANQSQVTQ